MGKIWKEDGGKVQEEYERRNCRRELEWISFAAQSLTERPFLEGPNHSQNPPQRSFKKLRESNADLPAVPPRWHGSSEKGRQREEYWHPPAVRIKGGLRECGE